MSRPWEAPLLVLCIAVAIIVAVKGAYRTGFEDATNQIAAVKAERDATMRKIGTCDWAKIIADNIQCKRQLP